MRIYKRIFASMLAAAMIIATFTGCADKDTDDTPPADTASKTEQTDESQNDEPKLSGEVVYWSMWQETEPQADILKQAIDEFEKANKDVKVTVEWSGRGVKELILPALESNQKVDIFDSDPSNMYKADPSKLMSLDDLYESKALDSDKTIKESLLGGLVEYDKSLGAEASVTGNHSVPYAPYVVSWFYNKDLFDKAGITETPKTWEEFDAVCSKLKEADIVPITTDDAYISLIHSYYLERGIGEDAIKKLAVENGELWDDPMILQTLKSMEDFFSKGYFSKDVKTNKFPAGQMEFAQGNAAMYLNASWFPAEVKEATGDDFKWGQFAYPTVPNGKGTLNENTIGGQAFMINANTDNKDATYELLKYFISEKTQEIFLEKGLVPCTSATDWPKTLTEQKLIVNDLTRSINWGASFTSQFIDGAVIPEINKVITGSTTADKCMEEILKQSKKYKE